MMTYSKEYLRQAGVHNWFQYNFRLQFSLGSSSSSRFVALIITNYLMVIPNEEEWLVRRFWNGYWFKALFGSDSITW